MRKGWASTLYSIYVASILCGKGGGLVVLVICTRPPNIHVDVRVCELYNASLI